MHPRIEDIPIGVENAITREELAALWNVDDRTAREIIEKFRKEDNGDDYVIFSSSQIKGYCRTNEREMMEHQENETMRRIRSLEMTLTKARRILGEVEK